MASRKRRGRGEGGICFREDKNLWEGSVFLGYGESGKRKRKTAYGKSKKEVQDQVREIQNRAATGQMADAGTLTVAAYLKTWLADTAAPRVARTTAVRYEQRIRRQIVPHLGRVQLAKFSPMHVQQLFSALERDGDSTRNRQMAGTLLHTTLRDAVRLRLIPHNPASDVRKPKPCKREMKVYSREQVARFLAAAEEDRLCALYVVAIDSGMRQGELFGLDWSDIDFDGGSVQVQRSLEELGGILRVKEPKSARGRRRIDLSGFALEALNRHRQRMLVEGRDVKSGPVFVDMEGGRLRKPNVINRSFRPAIARANQREQEAVQREGRAPLPDLPIIRFHDLRHTCASLLLSMNVNPKVVSERLGHATIALTLDTYSHVLPSMQRDAAARMGEMFKMAAGS